MFLDTPDKARYNSFFSSRFKSFIRKSALFVTGSSSKCYTSHVVRQKRKLKIKYCYLFFPSVLRTVRTSFRTSAAVISFSKGSVPRFIAELVLSFDNSLWGGKRVEPDGSSSNFLLALWLWYEDSFSFLTESNELDDVFNETSTVTPFSWAWKFKSPSAMLDNISREFVLEVDISEITN